VLVENHVVMTGSPIFIVGCPRSGTGLLRDLLRSHPHLTFPNESHFIPRLFRAYGDPQNEREARRLATIILNMTWVRAWGLSLTPSFFADCRAYREVLSRLYEEWMRKEGKIRWGDKTPLYVKEIPTLLEIFPLAKIIHIYRDGRDVALSWLHTDFGPKNLFTAACQWKYLVNTGLRTGASLSPETYLDISYETLLSRPEVTMKRVCAFLNEPFCDDVLRPNRLPPEVNVMRRNTWASDSEIIKSNTVKWKEAMSPSDRILFESVSGDLLGELGYETEGPTRRISRTEQLKWEMHNAFWSFRQILYVRKPGSWAISRLLFRWAELRSRFRSAKAHSLPR
jgi:hypothetical protein